MLQSSLYSEFVEGIVKHGGGVIVISLIQKVKHAGKEGELEDHLDKGIEGVGAEAHVVHETIPVPALTIQDVVHELLPKVPEGPEDRENAHVLHDAVEKWVVEEAHHKPYKAHWREELNLRQVPVGGEGDVPVAVQHDIEHDYTDTMDHTIHTVIVHCLAVGLVTNETSNVIFELTTTVTSVHLRVFAHTY